jgi:acyl-CoA reductase-like NAD-dependent aldehyde dehydrogenase
MQAEIFFGSTRATNTNLHHIKNPYTNQIVSTYPMCSAEDATKALHIAQNAAKEAKNSPLHRRISWLEDVASKMEEEFDDFAKTIVDEVGKPMLFAKAEVQRCIELLRLSAATMLSIGGETFATDATPSGRKSLSYFMREPVGVVVAITPFNFPLNLVAHKIAPALVSGNAVVLKPTPEAPLCAYKFVKLFTQSPYAIKDAISLVYGDREVGEALTQSDIPRVVSFTGSVPVGNAIIKNAGIKKVALELGGNAATFVDKSADIAEAAEKCAKAAFYNSGQVCISLQRIYVHTDIYDEFASQMAQSAKKLSIGDPYDDATFMGPLINKDAVDKAQNWCQSALSEGAVALCGAKSEGNIFYPTIMTEVDDSMQIVCEEAFAPIVSLLRVDDFDGALHKINNSPYGLQYSIFTNDLSLAKRAIDEYECGGVVVNDVPSLRFDIQPYGGAKLSGIGKEGPRYAIEDDFTQIKSVVIF